MSEAPKKIWWNSAEHKADAYSDFGTGTISYIRVDIVDELVEALEIIKSRVCGDPNPNWHDADARFASRAFIADVADTALAKLEDV